MKQGGGYAEKEAEELRRLAEALPKGAKNAVDMATLAKLYGVSERKIRELVRAARESGQVIIGDAKGYYRPGTLEEVETYYRAVKKRAIGALNSAKAARLLIKELGGST